MSEKNINLVFRLLNIWCAIIMFLFFLSHLPHWPGISFHSWLNQAIYFLLFLLAFNISVKEKNNRSIFINLAIYLFLYSLSLFNIFLGKLQRFIVCSISFCLLKQQFSIPISLIDIGEIISNLVLEKNNDIEWDD